MIASQASMMNDSQQYTRRNSIRVFGVPESAPGRKEDTDEVVCDLFQRKLGMAVSVSEICRTHRLTSKSGGNTNERLPRPIIVKFTAYNTRRCVFTMKRRLKGSGLVVKEDLTSYNAKMLKQAQHTHGMRNVWTVNGQILFIDPDTKKIQRYRAPVSGIAPTDPVFTG